jgi:hypothetical protein
MNKKGIPLLFLIFCALLSGFLSHAKPKRELQAILSSPVQAAPLEDGTTIRVLVVYTRTARIAASGTHSIELLIQEAVDKTNLSYLDSGIMQNLVLAGMREINYIETGDLGADLVALQNPLHAELGGIHSWRDQDYADLVNLVVSEGDRCYASYQMTEVSQAFEAYAFSVVTQNCMIAELGFPMALGHNMGARLDWFNDDGTMPYTDSHGHVNWTAGWRTVMTTDSLCAAHGVSCQHLWRWSNPQQIHNGFSMGVLAGTNDDCIMGVENNPDCDADNARVLNATAPTVANFRVGAPPPTPPPAPTPAVLLVNDEGSFAPEVEHYYAEALQALLVSFDIFNTLDPGWDEPNATEIAPYEIVIWFTGRNSSVAAGPSTGTTEQVLTDWLAQGNCFLLMSQDYDIPNGIPTTFMQETLGIQSVTNDVAHSLVTGFGPFTGMGSLTLAEPPEYPTGWNFTDSVQPGSGAVVAFSGDQGTAGLFKMTRTYRTSYLAFPLEMLLNPQDRAALLERFISSCQFEDFFLPAMSSP